ncbi:hypothetical protein BH11ARM2_BH11ARM2_17390 [soil metagenome]
MTETLGCDVAPPAPPPAETEFEKRRGVSDIELRDGFAQVYVEALAHPVMAERLRILRAVADVNVSLDFLKLTPTGLSFLVPGDRASVVEDALKGAKACYDIRRDRAIVLVHAVNIRDEEGLLADIVQEVIAQGATIDHIGDMHDRLLMVLDADAAARTATYLKGRLIA